MKKEHPFTMKVRYSVTFMLFVACIGMGIISAFPNPAAANPKAEELEQKIADITLLHNQLNDRTHQAATIRNALIEQKDALSAEVAVLVKSLNIKTLSQARRHHRIRYNLELLRTIWAYLDQFEAKLLFYQTGRDKLGYLKQLSDDDIKMINTLNDMKIDALTTQISLVVNRYLPEAHAIEIDPDRIDPPSSEKVWRRIQGHLN